MDSERCIWGGLSCLPLLSLRIKMSRHVCDVNGIRICNSWGVMKPPWSKATHFRLSTNGHNTDFVCKPVYCTSKKQRTSQWVSYQCKWKVKRQVSVSCCCGNLMQRNNTTPRRWRKRGIYVTLKMWRFGSRPGKGTWIQRYRVPLYPGHSACSGT